MASAEVAFLDAGVAYGKEDDLLDAVVGGAVVVRVFLHDDAFVGRPGGEGEGAVGDDVAGPGPGGAALVGGAVF